MTTNLPVPTPFGLALILGLRRGWVATHPAPAGARLVRVEQVSGGPAYLEQLLALDRLTRRHGLGHLADIIPWAYTLPGPVGLMDLVACRPASPHGGGWLWLLGNPRPAWAPDTTPQAAAAPAGPLPTAESRPAAAPLEM